MGSRQLIVFGFVLACVGLSAARLFSVTVPTHWEVEEQKPAEVEAKPAAAGPDRARSMKSAQPVGKLQSRRNQPAMGPLSWKFPEDPVAPVKKLPVEFELRRPAAASRVAVRCGESRIQVEVSQDLLGIGKLIEPEEITLGGCPPTEVDSLSHVIVFECELHTCGSRLVV